MRVVMGEREGTRVTLEVEVEAGALERALDDAARNLGRRVKIPGFRPGRAPRSLVERYVGADAVREEAVDLLLPESYRRVLDQTGLDPIDRPSVEILKAEPGQPFVFKVTVDAKPEVALGEYNGLNVPRDPVSVTDDDVQQELEGLAQRLAAWAPSDAPAVAAGHRAVIDYTGRVGGEPFEGGAGEARPVEVGAETLLPEFEQGLLGMAPGATKEVQVGFPEDYPNPALTGRSATFTVTVRAIEERRVPPVDDALAQAAGLSSLDELREAIRRQLLAVRRQAADRAQRERILDAITANAEVEVPEVLVERRIGRAVEDLRHRLGHEGMTLEQYLELSGKDEAALRADFRTDAEAAVRRELVLKAIALKEGLRATDTEVAQLARAQGLGGGGSAGPGPAGDRGRGKARRRGGRRAKRLDPAVLEGLRDVLTLEKAAAFAMRVNAAEEPEDPAPAAEAQPDTVEAVSPEAAPAESPAEDAPPEERVAGDAKSR